MLLVIAIGSSNIRIGLYEGRSLRMQTSMRVDTQILSLIHILYSFYPEAGQVVEQASLTSGNVLSTITAAIKALYKNNVPKNAAFSLEVSPDFLEKMLLADVI